MTSGYTDVVFGLTGKRTLQPRSPWKICKCDENNVNCCWIADVLYYVLLLLLLLFCTARVCRGVLSSSDVDFKTLLYYYYNDLAAEERMGGMTRLSCNTV